MSHEVWKYAIDATQRSVRTFDVPAGARFLACDSQRESVVMWFLVDVDMPKVQRKFEVYPTGYPINEPMGDRMYVGTVQFHGFEGVSPFVVHVFEYAPISPYSHAIGN